MLRAFQQPASGNVRPFVWLLLPILSGCATIHTVGTPVVGPIAVQEKFPTSAVVLIDQSTVEKLTRKRPVLIAWNSGDIIPNSWTIGGVPNSVA